ncbi:DUF4198 domain-containing protein [Acanthopleuribacter pedis]|uniref:DUF4198 domain-containing protein n=1 Tax=Acanthopleuribacter pedis TaxID=442870 RepID=A0A8J7QAX2_9BACT|nr:DUF4198 domain-containing protein [Acanthopleuribacter pedis]MBO1320284.1 DUF4198 domain-containing protein [Acanthopleuribacter pedis]
MNLVSRMSLLFLALTTCVGFAHDRFIVPSHTILSGEKTKSVSLTASISNDVFHPDRPLGDNGKGWVPPSLKAYFDRMETTVILPDGSKDPSFALQSFRRFSAGDLELKQDGTYRISLVHDEAPMVTFTKADGSFGRAFGKEARVPEGATKVVRKTTASRVETFVTRNNANRAAIQPTGHLLELAGSAHPNDLFVGEAVSFQLFHAGKPLAKPAEVVLVRGGTRHRNQRDKIEATTDATGTFEVVFPEAGFYLLQTEVMVPGRPGSGMQEHWYSLFVTLEVFPM